MPALLFGLVNYFIFLTLLSVALKSLNQKVYVKESLKGGFIGAVISLAAFAAAMILTKNNEAFWLHNKTASAALIISTCVIAAVALIGFPIILNLRRRRME